MTRNELIDKATDHAAMFHTGEAFYIAEVLKAERTVIYLADGYSHYVTYRRDGLIEWGITE